MHDKKSSHVGNHGGAYVDNDGQSRQFTYVDHDVKTSVATGTMTDRDKAKIKDDLATYRAGLILKISILPPSLCPDVFSDFTLRGADRDRIEWNEKMLQDPGLPLQKLIDMWTLVSKRAEAARHTF